MIISSELTGKTYKTVEECIAAEKEFFRKKEEEEKAKMAHQKELDEAYEEAISACERYFKLAGVNVDIDEKNSAVEISGKTSEGVDNTFDLLWRLISE